MVCVECEIYGKRRRWKRAIQNVLGYTVQSTYYTHTHTHAHSVCFFRILLFFPFVRRSITVIQLLFGNRSLSGRWSECVKANHFAWVRSSVRILTVAITLSISLSSEFTILMPHTWAVVGGATCNYAFIAAMYEVLNRIVMPYQSTYQMSEEMKILKWLANFKHNNALCWQFAIYDFSYRT